MDSGSQNEKIQTEQTGSQKVGIGFVHYILSMEFQLKQIHCQPCMWATIEKAKKTRRPLFKYLLPVKKIRVEEFEMETGIINNEINPTESTTKLSSSVVFDGHFYCWRKDNPKCLVCVDQRNLIKVLINEINELTSGNKLLKRKTLCYENSNRSCFTWHKIKADAKKNFYTGIQTIEMFNVIFIFFLIAIWLPHGQLWAIIEGEASLIQF